MDLAWCIFALLVVVNTVSADEEFIDYVVTEEVWFEVYGERDTGKPIQGKIIVALFGNTVPMTVNNIIGLCRGYKKENEILQYRNVRINRIIEDFVIQFGDVDGKGGKSIYGPVFDDENFLISHRSAGWVSMANSGRDTNGSQIFILLSKARWLDGDHVVFGKVVKGMDLVREIGEMRTHKSDKRPVNNIRVVDSGVVNIKQKYLYPKHLLDSEEDFKK